MDRLFFAVLPDDDAKARIAALAARLRREHALTGTPIAPGRLHVSLYGVGSYGNPTPEVITAVEQAGTGVEASSFEVQFDRVLSFKRSSSLPLVLAGGNGLAALTAFRRALGVEMTKVGMRHPVRSSFTPHLTLLYDDHPIHEMDIDSIAWTVREFVLVQSLYGRGRHVHLVRWPLRHLSTRSSSGRGA